jgi:hypothetical protein
MRLAPHRFNVTQKMMSIKKLVIRLSIIVLLLPVIYYGSFIALLSWDAYGYNRFQEELKSKFKALKSETLQITVCHEWKCIFEYKRKDKENYQFQIYGRENIDQRLAVMLEISEDIESKLRKCRYIQEGSNMCQI